MLQQPLVIRDLYLAAIDQKLPQCLSTYFYERITDEFHLLGDQINRIRQ